MNEVILIEAGKLAISHTTCQCWNMIDIGLRHHGCHSGRYIACIKFITDMRFPKCNQIINWSDTLMQCGNTAFMSKTCGGFVIMFAVWSGKGMIYTLIDISLNIAILGGSIQNLLACLWRCKLV
ncbi:hypothetical protein D3C75_783430 [compost metagenome]